MSVQKNSENSGCLGINPSPLDLTRSNYLCLEAHFNVGEAYLKMLLPNEANPLLDEAENNYRKALVFNPMNAPAISGLERVARLRSGLLEHKADTELKQKTSAENADICDNIYILVKSSSVSSDSERGVQSNRIIRFTETSSFPDKNDATLDEILKTHSGLDSITIGNMLTLMDNLGYHEGGAVIAGIYDGRKPAVQAGYKLHKIPKTKVKQYLTMTAKPGY